ncbi:UNVERIFIED_CONTAM: hypothetical protein K2H54_055417 [Gekko kuhli]
MVLQDRPTDYSVPKLDEGSQPDSCAWFHWCQPLEPAPSCSDVSADSDPERLQQDCLLKCFTSVTSSCLVPYPVVKFMISGTTTNMTDPPPLVTIPFELLSVWIVTSRSGRYLPFSLKGRRIC